MLRPSMVTLKHILVNFYSVYEVDDDPLFGTPSEFEEMRTKNFIETVTILVEMDARCRRLGAEETVGVGLTKYSHLRSGFR